MKPNFLTLFILAAMLVSFSSCGKRPAKKQEEPLKPVLAEAKAAALRGDHEKAAAAVEEEIKRNPQDIEAYTAKAEIFENAGNKQKAYEAYGEAIKKAKEIRPEHPPYYLMEQKKRLFNELLEEQPDTIDPDFKDDPPPPDDPEPAGDDAVAETSEEPTKTESAAEPASEAVAEPSSKSAASAETVQAPAAEEADVPAAEPEKVPAAEPITGDVKITLIWSEPVDVDLKVEDDSGEKQKLTQESQGSESFILKAEEMGGKYYAAVSLIGAMGAKASVTMSLQVPGKAAVEQKAELAYDGTHQFWVAFSIDTSSGEVKTINAFESSIQKYKEKE